MNYNIFGIKTYWYRNNISNINRGGNSRHELNLT